MYSEYLPRVRIEWLLAGGRVMLAAGALVGALVGSDLPGGWLLVYGLAWFLFYSLLVMALVWTPVRFARGWGLALHAFDLAAFAGLAVMGDTPTNSLLAYFTFLAIVGMLRWEARGVLWTSLAAGGIYVLANVYAWQVEGMRPLRADLIVIRLVHFAVIAGLIAYLGAYHNRFHREITRLVSWPRRITRDLRELIEETIAQCAEVFDAPRVLIVWEDPDEGAVNLAWGDGSGVSWANEPESTYGSFVVAGLEHRSFQAANVDDDMGLVVHWSADVFRQRACAPINAALQDRFAMKRVQSWSLDGELIRGRIFALDKPQHRLDDLVFGEVVARLVVSRLDGLYLLRRLRKAAAFEERLRVARDMHDSLLQSAAGTALQLLAARRLLAVDPDQARKRLEDVQNQIEQDELEMRAFIRRLRPAPPSGIETPSALLADRLEELRRRVERQWEVKVRIRPLVGVDRLPDALDDDVYRIVQEAVLNAARHSDASVITVQGSVADELSLTIQDDGKGFPFHGTYDLDELHALDIGPLTLRERVAELRGRLTLVSGDTGTSLLIVLPLDAPRA